MAGTPASLGGNPGTGLGYGQFTTKSSFSLTPGNYTLSFLLGKNSAALPANARTMNVSSGSAFTTTLSHSLPYLTMVPRSFSFTVTGATRANLVFDYPDNGVNPVNNGYVLDQVVLTKVASAPEPTTLALLALGGTLLTLRRRKGTN